MNRMYAMFIFAIFIISTVFAQPADEEVKLSQEQAHEVFSIELNNRVWNLLGKPDRTDTENNEMIWAAYASLYHWSVIGQPINIQRGEWMVSHVMSVLNHPESAIYHADRCWKLTEELNLDRFDRGYALEALARANACAGNKEQAQKYYADARAYSENIKNPEDAELYISDLESGPWYGVIE